MRLASRPALFILVVIITTEYTEYGVHICVYIVCNPREMIHERGCFSSFSKHCLSCTCRG